MNQTITTSDPAIDGADPDRHLGATLDRGLALLGRGEPGPAAEALAEAVALAYRLRDPSLAGALAALGRALLALGRHDDARRALCPAAALAREAGDPHAEKDALGLLAAAQAQLGQRPEALLNLDRALVLAVQVGDRPHEAALLWHSAALHDALGDRENALKYGGWAVDLLRRLADPRVAEFARHLAHYRDAAPPAPPTGPAGPRPFRTATPVEARPLAPAQAAAAPPADGLPAGPGLLAMAAGAAAAAARFAGSGFQTVPEAAYRARLAACSTCEHHTGLRCRLCGCFTAAKARMPHEHCPDGRWPRD